jgi:hypothetical protein
MKHLMVVFMLLALVFGCASTDTYRSYVIADKELTAIAEQYDTWYQIADSEQQAQWRNDIDPLFIEMDKLMDDWQLLLLAGEDTDDIVLAVNRIKSRILAELMKHMEDK